VAVERLFKDLHGRYFARLIRFVQGASASLRGRAAVCEELALDSFVKLWKYRASYRGDCALYTFLCQIAMNLVLSHLRAEKRSPEVPLEPEDDVTELSPADREARADWLAWGDEQQRAIDERRIADCVRKRLQALEDSHAEHVAALRMQYEAGLKGPDIARAIGRTEGATREFLRQARIVARRIMGECWSLLTGTSR
jgi:RNA polymerase sigma factor (sigma-70 family)